ncbi:MAG: trypsin-like peptidase domain-containing protein [Ferruginibacter sp.]
MSTIIERYVIRHVSGTKASQVEEFDFDKPELSIGRASTSDIQFDPEQETVVSREHGKIVKVSADPPKFTVTDNNSRNGIFVNKSRVKGTVPLSAGDEVQLGSNGPVFTFDVYPRPQDMMAATRVIEIPTTIRPTTITDVQPSAVNSGEPVKTGLGKQTVERMLVNERKKSTGKMAMIIGSLLVVLIGLSLLFKDSLFPKPGETKIVNNIIQDSTTKNKRSPEMIAKENIDKVVQIEFGWQLFDANTSDELWHKYQVVKGADGVSRYTALYIQNSRGTIEPFVDVKKNVPIGTPIGFSGATGSGFVVSEDGFILTNRHVATNWNTRYGFAEYAFPGVLVQNEGNKLEIVPNVSVMPQDVAGWVPGEASMIGGQRVNEGSVKGRNTYMNVIFANTSLRRPVQSATPSDDHDVAMIKVELPESLTKVNMKDNYDQVKPGQMVTVMGYPGVAPEQFVVRKSNDPFKPNSQFSSVPTPTVTTGNIGRIIPASSDKNLTYSAFGDSYQLTINATGAGNSGGPMFDDEGNVIGLYYAGRSDAGGTQISFAVPIKYGLELMGRKKVAN